MPKAIADETSQPTRNQPPQTSTTGISVPRLPSPDQQKLVRSRSDSCNIKRSGYRGWVHIQVDRYDDGERKVTVNWMKNTLFRDGSSRYEAWPQRATFNSVGIRAAQGSYSVTTRKPTNTAEVQWAIRKSNGINKGTVYYDDCQASVTN